MNNKITYNGEIRTVEEINSIGKITLVVNGSNNIVNLNKFEGQGSLYIEMNCNNSVFEFGKNNTIRNNVFVFYPVPENSTVENVKISIGDENIFNGQNIIILSPMYENNEIKIGNGNLFASNITIRGRNDHIIFDKKSKKIIGREKSVILGDSNWICDNVQIMSKTIITNNNVIGLGSIVNKPFKNSNTLIVGVPAMVKKKNICWSRASKYEDIDFENPINIKEKFEE